MGLVGKRGGGADASGEVTLLDGRDSSPQGAPDLRRVYRFGGGFVSPTPLFPYQAFGVSAMVSREWMPLRDGTGRGKTVQALYCGKVLLSRGLIDAALYVIKSARVATWEEEFSQHLPGEDPRILIGLPRGERQWGDSPFVVTSFELLSRSVGKRGKRGEDMREASAACSRRRVAVFLDDGDAIAHSTSKSCRAVCLLGQLAVRRYLLNATLVSDKAEEVWSQYYFLDRGATFGESLEDFMERYTVRRNIYVFKGRHRILVPKIIGYKRLRELGRKLNSTSLCRSAKMRSLGVPDQVVVPLRVTPCASQRAALLDMATALRQELGNFGPQEKLETIKRASALVGHLIRQMILEAACGAVTGLAAPAKLEMMLDRHREMGSQMVAWFHHREVGERISALLRERRISCGLVHAGVTGEARDEVLDRFYSGDTRVLVGSYGTLSQGENKLKRCPHAYYAELTWSLRKWDQSLGRFSRVGGTSGMDSGEHKGLVVMDRPELGGSLDGYQVGHLIAKKYRVRMIEKERQTRKTLTMDTLREYLDEVLGAAAGKRRRR